MARARRARNGEPPDYARSVFINCPFDEDYRPTFDALVFAVHACGFLPRCALEDRDSSQVRVEKICGIIGACRLGIHDISRTELTAEGLPRFNMPFELGLFLGARRLGEGHRMAKRCLILDRERDRYRRFLSDIAGQDPEAHGGRPAEAIRAVRHWLATIVHAAGGDPLPGAEEIARRYAQFRRDVEEIARARLLDGAEARTFADNAALIRRWLARFAQASPEGADTTAGAAAPSPA